MCWDDFKRMFCEVSIVRDDDSYAFNSVAVPTLEVGRVFGVELTVRQDSNVTVEVHQPSKRAYAKEALTFQYGGVALQAWRCRGVLSRRACGLCVHGRVYDCDAVSAGLAYVCATKGGCVYACACLTFAVLQIVQLAPAPRVVATSLHIKSQVGTFPVHMCVYPLMFLRNSSIALCAPALSIASSVTVFPPCPQSEYVVTDLTAGVYIVVVHGSVPAKRQCRLSTYASSKVDMRALPVADLGTYCPELR